MAPTKTWFCPACALKVYLLQLVRVSAAWQVPQLTGFLDERASMMGVQGQISDVLEHVDRMESLCVDLQHQVRNQNQKKEEKDALSFFLSCHRRWMWHLVQRFRPGTLSSPG